MPSAERPCVPGPPARGPCCSIPGTAGGRHPDVFSSFETFAMLSSTIEDVGVAAFEGQIGNLAGTSVLSTALQIHSVEGSPRQLGPVVGKSGSEDAFDKPIPKNEVLEAGKP